MRRLIRAAGAFDRAGFGAGRGRVHRSSDHRSGPCDTSDPARHRCVCERVAGDGIAGKQPAGISGHAGELRSAGRAAGGRAPLLSYGIRADGVSRGEMDLAHVGCCVPGGDRLAGRADLPPGPCDCATAMSAVRCRKTQERYAALFPHERGAFLFRLFSPWITNAARPGDPGPRGVGIRRQCGGSENPPLCASFSSWADGSAR